MIITRRLCRINNTDVDSNDALQHQQELVKEGGLAHYEQVLVEAAGDGTGQDHHSDDPRPLVFVLHFGGVLDLFEAPFIPLFKVATEADFAFAVVLGKLFGAMPFIFG